MTWLLLAPLAGCSSRERPTIRAADSVVVVTDSLFHATVEQEHRVLPHVEEGFDPAVVTAIGRTYRLPCYRYPQMAVVVVDTGSNVGEDVIVRELPPLASVDSPRAGCGMDSLPGDFVLRNADASYFLGVKGPLLFIDNGTGDVRALTLYHIPSRRQVLHLGGYDLAGWRNDSTLAIWKATRAAAKHCVPDPRFAGVRVDSLYELRLSPLEMLPTRDTRCSQLQ